VTAAAPTLPGIPSALADELRLHCGPDTWSVVNVREALATYASRTSDWRAARDLGDIVETHDADDAAAGVKYRAATAEGGRVLAAWQRARAELVAAVENRRRVLGGRR